MDQSSHYLDWPVLLVLTIIVFTVGGNIVVILAVSLEKKLQNATNFFLRSLALTDMLVGILVMPISLSSILYKHSWPFPRVLCPLWIYLDVLLSTSSIMHLCAISVDRYIGIRNPIKYSQFNSLNKTVVKIAMVWSVSVVLSLPVPIIGLQNQEKVFVNDKCELNDKLFISVGSFIAFFVPLMIMMVSYCLTVRVLRHHATFLQRKEIPLISPQPSDAQDGQNGKQGMASALKKETRASKVLGIVFLLFVLLWCPFFITNMVLVLCTEKTCNQAVLDKMLDIFVWVGYVSSGVNPLVYTLFNKTYRQAFCRILRCKYKTEAAPPASRNVNGKKERDCSTARPFNSGSGPSTEPSTCL
ncbi:5-hydroxytryptamine receptor 2C-like [Denticeps clupeoides]|uniref:5-hydroxytryptamine receptor 2C-like n=1 Tax=Denticeps clupeoides TaxID=299321 RepID=UPI0010A3824C|nr:5-hydroxytryptamine receptor 2C-like [Denticeps clupeoides]